MRETTQQLQVEQTVAELLSTAVAEAEVLLDSDLPAAVRFLCCYPRMAALSAQAAQGAVELAGAVEFTVLYEAEEGVYSTGVRRPFTHRVIAEEVQPEMEVEVTATIAPAAVRRVDERCARTECVVEMTLRVTQNMEKQCVGALEGEGLESQSQNVRWAYPACVTAGATTIREDVELASDAVEMERLLFCDGQVQVERAMMDEEGVRVEGCVNLSLCYATTQPALPMAWTQCQVPFESVLDGLNMAEDALIMATGSVQDLSIRIHADLNDARRILAVDIPLTLRAVGYTCCAQPLLSDAFALDRELMVEAQSMELTGQPRLQRVETTVSGQLALAPNLPEPERLLGAVAAPVLDVCLVSKGRLQLSGRLITVAFYTGQDQANLFAVPGSAAFETEIPVEGLAATDRVQVSLQALQTQLMRSMQGLELRAKVAVVVCSRSLIEPRLVTSVTEGEPLDLSNLSDLMLVAAGPGDTLWSLARSCRVPISMLKACNPCLRDREVQPTDRLVIVR